MKIEEIPIDELLQDLCDSAADRANCLAAISCGKSIYSRDANILERANKNAEFIVKISTEIKRRLNGL